MPLELVCITYRIAVITRQSLSASVLILYLAPLLFFATYSTTLMAPHKSWMLLSLGLLLVVLGSLALIALLFYWEQALRFRSLEAHTSKENGRDKIARIEPLTSPIDETIPEKSIESLEDHAPLAHLLQLKTTACIALEETNQVLERQLQGLAQDFADYKLFSEEQLRQKQLQMTALQHMLEEQKTEMESRQEQIHHLDSRVHELSEEIKAFLQPSPVEEVSATSSVVDPLRIHWDLGASHHRTTLSQPVAATLLLTKCLQAAEKLTGAHYAQGSPFSPTYYAIEQRQLFDQLNEERGALIFLYSPQQEKLLFANQEIKELFGWPSEKCASPFLSLVQGGEGWQTALHSLDALPQVETRLLARTKQGEECLLYCHLGKISAGLFRHAIIGVLHR